MRASARGCAGALAALLLAALAGCATGGAGRPEISAGEGPRRIELDGTPFFPQLEHQCGPAALATVLVASGQSVTPAELVQSIYLPGRKGSLQPELLATAREHMRLPYVLPPSLDAVVAQLAAGIPVLVLQKLGFGPWPGWHYAVVIGYDADRQEFLLRSGTERREILSVAYFEATWQRAQGWAFVALRPGELPAQADPRRYLEAAAGLEAVGRLSVAGLAYEAGVARWPRDPLLRLGLANVALAQGDTESAERDYREVIRLSPDSVAAHNNLAELLARRGCSTSAHAELAVARRLAAGGPFEAAVADTAAVVESVADGDAPGCPAH